MKLTIKQRKFVDAYVECGNATQAALEAGYSKRTAARMGSENLRKPDIKKAIEKRMAELSSKKIAKADEVLRYLTTVLRGEARETIVVATKLGTDEIENPPSIKDRMAAGRELLKRYPDSDELLRAQIRRAKAEADVAEAKAKAYRSVEGENGGLTQLLAAIDGTVEDD